MAHNQLILQSRILQIEQVLNTVELKNIETYNYFLIEMVISQITTAFEVIYGILEKIEIAITFSKLNTFHNSIIKPEELLNEIKLISVHLTKNKLPFEPILENILLIERTVNIKSYSKHNKIIFILEIPIVEHDNYNYYHLYSLPTPKNNAFEAILPQSKYLILNEQNYMFSDLKCQELATNEFICHDTSPVKIKEETEAPCEVQMLKYSKNITNCQPIPAEIKNIKIQKIEKNQWILIIPQDIVAVQKCGVNKDNVPLKGTYVLELNLNCEVQIKDVQIRNYQNIINNFKTIDLPKLDINNIQNKNSFTNFKPLKMDAINLDEIKLVQGALETQRKNIKSFSEVPIHFNNISIWTIILYIILIVLIIYILYYLYNKQLICKPQNEVRPQELPNVRLPNPVVASPRILV